MKEKREAANAAYNQVNTTKETLTSLRKERVRLEELNQREQWGAIEENLHNDQAAVERMQQEILLLAGQENFPLPSIQCSHSSKPHSFYQLVYLRFDAPDFD